MTLKHLSLKDLNKSVKNSIIKIQTKNNTDFDFILEQWNLILSKANAENGHEKSGLESQHRP